MNTESSHYWKGLSEKIVSVMNQHGGYANFKRTAGNIFNDDFMPNPSIYNLDIKRVWDKVKNIVPDDISNKLYEPLEGNPLTAILDGRHVSIDLGCSLLEYWNLSKHFSFSTIQSICEFGGGYGRTAYVIKKLHPHIKYTMVDIEPSRSLAHKYMHDIGLSENMEFILPYQLEDEPYDLCIAINCLGEMTRNNVKYYMDYADKNSKYFYMVVWEEIDVPVDNIVWKYPNDYPIPNNWQIMFKKPYVRNSWLEVLYKI